MYPRVTGALQQKLWFTQHTPRETRWQCLRLSAHSHHKGHEAFLSVHTPWNCPASQRQSLEVAVEDGNSTMGPQLPQCCTQASALPRQWLPLVITSALMAGGFSPSLSPICLEGVTSSHDCNIALCVMWKVAINMNVNMAPAQNIYPSLP